MNWKEINGYEGYYEVSDTGLVRSVDRYVPDKKLGVKYIRGKMLKLTESVCRGSNDGYLVVNLHKYNVSTVIPVHRIVAETFIENTENKPTVNHKDGNKHNNEVSNLEWSTYTENNIHALDNNLRLPRGNTVIQETIDGKFVAIYKSICDASRKTGIGRSMISHCVNNRCDIAGGYKWKKAKECNDYLTYESTTEDELPLEVREQDY